MPNLINPHTGELQFIPAEDLHHLGPGWREETAQETFARSLDTRREEEYGGGLSGVEAGLEGVMSGATLGLWDAVDDGFGARMRASYNQGWRAAGELAGGLAPALLTDGGSEAVEAGEGAGLLARVLKASPAGMVGRGGTMLAEALGDTRVAKVVAAAAEGSAFGMGGAFSQAQLSDDPLTIEALWHGAGIGALTGGGLSIGFQGLGELGKGIAKLRGGAEDALSQESAGLHNFGSTWEEMRDYHASPEPPPRTVAEAVAPQGPPTVTEPPSWSVEPSAPIEGVGPSSSGVPEPVTPEPRPETAGGGVPEVVTPEYTRGPRLGDPMPSGDTARLAPESLAQPPEMPVGTPGGGGDTDTRELNLTNPGKLGVRGGRDTLVDRDFDATKAGEAGHTAALGAPGGDTQQPLVWGSDREDLPRWLYDAKTPGPRGAADRVGRAARADAGGNAWEARLNAEAVPEPVHGEAYVGETETQARTQAETPPGPPQPGQVPPAPQESGHELWKTLHSLHGAKDMPALPKTLSDLAGLSPVKAVKVGMTLNALGEHSADLESRVKTLLSDLEGELGVKTPQAETPAQRWMALRKAAREAENPGATAKMGKAQGTAEAAPGRGVRQGFMNRWRRRLLGNAGESAGRAAGGGKGFLSKVTAAGGREGGYVLAALAGPKGLGLALGGKWLLKSRFAELLTKMGEVSTERLTPLARTAAGAWLRDPKKATKDILNLHAQAPNAGNLVYSVIERGHPGSAVTAALVQKAQAVAGFLSSLAPHPGPGLAALSWQPALSSLVPLVQATEAIAQPQRALARVLAGQASKEAVQALWLTYPQHMAEAILQMQSLTDAQLKRMTPVRRQAMSLLMQTPLDAISPWSPGAAALRASLFSTGAAAAHGKVQAYQAQQKSQQPPGRPPETTKLDAMMSGGRP